MPLRLLIHAIDAADAAFTLTPFAIADIDISRHYFH
jgi:hypothetical protein